MEARDFQLDLGVPDTLRVSGVLSFDTAATALQEMRLALAKGRVTQLDLSGVRRSDSAGLSCLVAIVAESSHAGRPLRVLHVPAGLQALAQVCEVDRYLA